MQPLRALMAVLAQGYGQVVTSPLAHASPFAYVVSIAWPASSAEAAGQFLDALEVTARLHEQLSSA